MGPGCGSGGLMHCPLWIYRRSSGQVSHAQFLLAISSLKRIADLQALSISCLEFAPGMVRAFLYPRVRYVPKVPTSSPGPIVLQAFCPPPFQKVGQERLNLLCPVWALDAYAHRAAPWHKADQLFVCFGPPKKGSPATEKIMSRWVVKAISLAYKSSGLPSPMGVRVHLTRIMAASKAFNLSVALQEIWAAAGWSSPHTFVRFYNLDLASTLGSQVLSSWCAQEIHTQAGTCSYGAVGIFVLKVFSRCSSSSWWGTSPGYVCNHAYPEGTRCCVSLPYSLHPCRRYFIEANLRVCRMRFYTSWLFTSPRSWHPAAALGCFTRTSEHSHTGAFQKRFLDTASRSLGEPWLHL